LHIRLAHQEVDRVGAMAALRHHDVEDRLDGIAVARRGDLADPFSLYVRSESWNTAVIRMPLPRRASL